MTSGGTYVSLMALLTGAASAAEAVRRVAAAANFIVFARVRRGPGVVEGRMR
jgi:hypothetical protein